MTFRSRPAISQEGNALVVIELGNENAILTASQAEDVAQSLYRAATASRYEAGISRIVEAQGLKGEEAINSVRCAVAEQVAAKN